MSTLLYVGRLSVNGNEPTVFINDLQSGSQYIICVTSVNQPSTDYKTTPYNWTIISGAHCLDATTSDTPFRMTDIMAIAVTAAICMSVLGIMGARCYVVYISSQPLVIHNMPHTPHETYSLLCQKLFYIFQHEFQYSRARYQIRIKNIQRKHKVVDFSESCLEKLSGSEEYPVVEVWFRELRMREKVVNVARHSPRAVLVRGLDLYLLSDLRSAISVIQEEYASVV